MKNQWFKRLGWFYAPVSVPGVIVTLIAMVFCAQVFMAVDHKSHSVSDTLYGIFPFFVCAFLLLDWIAERTSNRSVIQNRSKRFTTALTKPNIPCSQV